MTATFGELCSVSLVMHADHEEIDVITRQPLAHFDVYMLEKSALCVTLKYQ